MPAHPDPDKDEPVHVPINDPEQGLKALLQVKMDGPGKAWVSSMGQRQQCKDVWPGGCHLAVHPPRWKHGGKTHHPTVEMGLAAAKDLKTPPEVLMVLGAWDDEGVRTAALANPRYPSA